MIKPFKEQIPYVTEIETCLSIFVVFISLINLVGSMEEMAEEKPANYGQPAATSEEPTKKSTINLQKK